MRESVPSDRVIPQPSRKAEGAGAKDPATNRVAARVVQNTDARALQGFVREHVEPAATIYTDEAKAHKDMSEFTHKAVNHRFSEYVRDRVDTKMTSRTA